ncbi:SUKH-3 immunity protein [Streptomyces sp. Ncost-T10-10d]|nr:SUKH-3 immunity protein [Streptomyces sp. Ncost-T10-10d]
MELSSQAAQGGRSSVLDALRAAGWFEGRRFDCSAWIEALGAAGFAPNPLALRLWEEFGGLKIASSAARTPASSLYVEPMDACIDSLDEAKRLARRFGENFSPLGMWSIQFRSYVGESGRVVAVGPMVMWDLGSSFSEALAYVVNGDEGGSRAQEAPWLAEPA